MIYCKSHICNLYGLHVLYECVSSNVLRKKMICHMFHICDLCDLHELCGCVCSNCIFEKIICHKMHICILYGLHELYGCVSSNLLFEKIFWVWQKYSRKICSQIRKNSLWRWRCIKITYVNLVQNHFHQNNPCRITFIQFMKVTKITNVNLVVNHLPKQALWKDIFIQCTIQKDNNWKFVRICVTPSPMILSLKVPVIIPE